MWRGGIMAAVLAALLGATARAATCSDAETQQTDDLYVAAANTDACSQYASVLPWSVMIWWSCDNDACVAVMRQLAQDLPDCEDASGTNSKTDLEKSVGGCGGGTSTSSSMSSGSTGGSTVTATPTETPTTDAPTATTEAPVSASASAPGSGSSSESDSIIIATTAPPASSESSASESSSSTASGSLRSGDPASSGSSSNSATAHVVATGAALAV